MSADQEEIYRVAQANSVLDNLNQFVDDRVEIRVGETYTEAAPDAVDLIDVSPMQIMSVSAALIPFLEHDDANRALHGIQHAAPSGPIAETPSPDGGYRNREQGGPGQRSGSTL